MLKAGPLWALYTASYFIDFVIVLGILMWKKLTETVVNFPRNMNTIDWIVWVILIVLISFSILVMRAVKRIKMTSRIKIEPKDDLIWKVYTSFLAQVLAFAGIVVGNYGVLFALVVFVVMGIIFVKSKQVYFASLFIFPMRYKIFRGDGGIIITRNTRDELRLKMLSDGVQAKELERGIFLVQ